MSKEQMLVSVIVPVYNSAMFMKKCVESILAQHHTLLDVILVNDGSTDNSLEICHEYEQKDERIRVFSQSNSGVSAARNLGLKEARGDCICFVDSDDFLKSNAVELMLSELDDDVDFIQCRSEKIYANMKKDEEVWPEKEIVMDRMMAMRDYLCNPRPVVKFSVWGKLIRKSMFEGLQFESLVIREDVLLNIQLIAKSRKIKYIPDVLYYTNVREESLSRGHLDGAKIDSILECDRRILELLSSDIEFEMFLPRAWWSRVASAISLSKTIYTQKRVDSMQKIEYIHELVKKWEIPKGYFGKKQVLIYWVYRTMPRVFLKLVYRRNKA